MDYLLTFNVLKQITQCIISLNEIDLYCRAIRNAICVNFLEELLTDFVVIDSRRSGFR